jgi:putative spermidine/putrescine transport system ATP-binding protein
MQTELKSLHGRLGITVIHVTHDQSEAMAISDRIAVINHGRVEQCGAPHELYARPVNRFVADFVGESTFIDGIVEGAEGARVRIRTKGGLLCLAGCDRRLAAGAAVTLMIRPERFLFGDETAAADNRFSGEIQSVSFTGDRIKYEVALTAADWVGVAVANRRDAVPMPLGRHVDVGWRVEDAVVFPDG